MTNRDILTQSFFKNSNWREAQKTPLIADASMRRYTRLFDPSRQRSAIFMDAPPEGGEDVRPFIQVAEYLRSLGLSAPEIFETDEARGFLILEDLGTDMYDVVCDETPKKEEALYCAAVDALSVLAKATPLSGAVDYQPLMLDLAMAAYKWYAEPALEIDLSAQMQECRTAFAPCIDALGAGSVTILRDFHAQNLLWLPERAGGAAKNVGLLDFQDAMLGHPAYDLISLTTDARRDVPDEIRTMCMKRFADNLNFDVNEFEAAAAICSVQRNLRILMIFARMSLYFKRPHYVDLIPRVWAHLMRDISHPALTEVAHLVRLHLPEPTPETLARLKEKCGTVSTL